MLRQQAPIASGVGLLLVGLLATGCISETAGPDPVQDVTVADLQRALAPAAFSLLSPDGNLAVAPTQTTGFGVSLGQAAIIATAYAATFGPYFREEFERTAKQPIPFTELRVIGRELTAETPYVVNAPTLTPGARRLLGSYHIFTLGHRDMRLLDVAVSVDASIRIVDGEARFRADSGNDVFMTPIPQGRAGVGLSPEAAAIAAHSQTGARVVGALRLIRPPAHVTPGWTSWLVPLERAVPLGPGGSMVTEVMVDPEGSVFVPDESAPSSTFSLRSWSTPLVRPNQVSILGFATH